MNRLAVFIFLLSSGLVGQPNGFHVVQPPDTTEQALGRIELTEQSIIALARADARRYHKGWDWVLGGGLLGAGPIGVGAIVGGETYRSLAGFVLGFAVGALPVPLAVLIFPVSVPDSPQLEDAPPGQRELYQKTFIAESRDLRVNSIAIGEVIIGGVSTALLVFILISRAGRAV